MQALLKKKNFHNMMSFQVARLISIISLVNIQ